MGGVSMERKEVTLGEIGTIVGGATPSTKNTSFYDGNIPWLTPKDLSVNSNKYIFRGERNITEAGFKSCSCKMLPKGSVLFSSRAPIGYVAIAANDMCTNQGFKSVIPNEETDSEFLYYLLKYNKDNIASQGSGTTFAEVSGKTMKDIEVVVPKEKEDQRRIASILSSLDRKIELNNKINADLEEMAQAIFKNWFVDFEPFKDGKFVDSELGKIPEGWKVGRLTEIASYMNGLAMQKFPPENNEDSLPVLKIKELGQGFCGTDSDRCSCNIKDECKIHNGDVIFSWSGTLLVDVWCGGDCGLNQHLFKVTSKYYPKWFYYYWTKHHLQEFIHIAKDKAVTMGHIKRGHLEEALVAIPDNDSMERAHELFEPILSKMISLRLENSRLSLLRDTLLPRLMSGELEVPE